MRIRIVSYAKLLRSRDRMKSNESTNKKHKYIYLFFNIDKRTKPELLHAEAGKQVVQGWC